MSNEQLNTVPSYPKSAKKELVLQKLKNELLIYNLQNNQAICLNQTAALVWKILRRQKRRTQNSAKVGERIGRSGKC